MPDMKLSNRIAYAPIDALLHIIALLPLGVLYVISDCIFVILFHIVRYRRKVVGNNLRESFPEKSDAELSKIECRFYHFLCDYFVETVKLLHISDDEMRRRMEFHDVDLVDRCVDEGRSVILYCAHYCNWEWLPSIAMWFKCNTGDRQVIISQVYRPLKNEWFDHFFLNLRSRYSVIFTKKSVFRDLFRLKRDGKYAITGFLSDQHPSLNDTGYITRFLNHDTAMISGTETIARKLDFAVAYFDVERVRRGYYRCTIRPIALEPNAVEPNVITERYTRILEASIHRQPEFWLWTHKRWKHKVTLNNQQQ